MAPQNGETHSNNELSTNCLNVFDHFVEPCTIFTKSTILDVWQGSEYVSVINALISFIFSPTIAKIVRSIHSSHYFAIP